MFTAPGRSTEYARCPFESRPEFPAFIFTRSLNRRRSHASRCRVRRAIERRRRRYARMPATATRSIISPEGTGALKSDRPRQINLVGSFLGWFIKQWRKHTWSVGPVDARETEIGVRHRGHACHHRVGRGAERRSTNADVDRQRPAPGHRQHSALLQALDRSNSECQNDVIWLNPVPQSPENNSDFKDRRLLRRASRDCPSIIASAHLRKA